jgi:hypothetical protein
MRWVEIFSVFVVCHLVGDYLLQTEWQAVNKRGGLSGDSDARRALLMHVSTYTAAYVPALIWLAGDLGLATFLIAALIAGPHLVQDDGRLLANYMRAVKHRSAAPRDALVGMVDQSFHILALFLVALLAGRLS